MAIEFGKNLILPFLGTPRVGTQGVATTKTEAPKAFKTAGYASIPYERAPQVLDTVKTTDQNGNPLLPGYVTPKKAWVA